MLLLAVLSGQEAGRGGQTDASSDPQEVIRQAVRAFEELEAVSFICRFSSSSGDEADELVFDVLMAEGGRFRVRAGRAGEDLALMLSDGSSVVECDRGGRRWTRYSVEERSEAGPRLLDNQAFGFALARLAESWVTKPSPYAELFQHMQMAETLGAVREMADGRECVVLVATSQHAQGPVRVKETARIVHDGKTFLPLVQESVVAASAPWPFVVQGGGGRRAYRFEHMNVRTNVAASEFEFGAPDEYEFVDPGELRPAESPLVGQSVREWEVPLVGGGTSALIAEGGQGPTIVLTWATWCLPYKVALEALARLESEREFADVRIVAVSIDRDGAALARYLKDKKLPMMVGHDAEFLRRLGTEYVPVTLLIDAEGTVRNVWRLNWGQPESVDLLRGRIRELRK
jgi:thiol-disulfide isomerase/thioredoxin